MYFFAKNEYSGLVFIHCIGGYERISSYQASTTYLTFGKKSLLLKLRSTFKEVLGNWYDSAKK